MGNSRLMPLAPYILQAAPVASEGYLRQIKDALQAKMTAITQAEAFMERQQQANGPQRAPGADGSAEHVRNLNDRLLADLRVLQQVAVAGSVLIPSKIATVLQEIIAAGDKAKKGEARAVLSEQCVSVAGEIKAAWKSQGSVVLAPLPAAVHYPSSQTLIVPYIGYSLTLIPHFNPLTQ